MKRKPQSFHQNFSLVYIMWARKVRKHFIPLPQALKKQPKDCWLVVRAIFSAIHARETNICAIDQSKISAEAARLLLSSFLRNWITNFPNIVLFALPFFADIFCFIRPHTSLAYTTQHNVVHTIEDRIWRRGRKNRMDSNVISGWSTTTIFIMVIFSSHSGRASVASILLVVSAIKFPLQHA